MMIRKEEGWKTMVVSCGLLRQAVPVVSPALELGRVTPVCTNGCNA